MLVNALFFIPLTGVNAIPVSYTHLDVYKRQSVLSLSDGEKSPFFPELSVIPLPYDALARHVCDRLTADVEGRFPTISIRTDKEPIESC